MEAVSFWKAWVDCHNEHAAHRVLERLRKQLSLSDQTVEVQPYHKGGFTLIWKQQHYGASWAEIVVDAIARGQRVASGWILSGDIGVECSALATRTGGSHIQAPGVTMLTWELERPVTQ